MVLIFIYFDLFQVVRAGSRMVEGTKLGSSFIFRAADMRNRVRVHIDQNMDAVGTQYRPYQLTFYNLAYGDRDGDYPIELQHGQSGYLWLEGSHYVAHNTNSGHKFTIRDANHMELFSVIVFDPNDGDEL